MHSRAVNARAHAPISDLTRPVPSCARAHHGLHPLRAPQYNKKPVGKFMQLENHNIFLNQLKAKSIKLVNIGGEDLWSGDRKLILGLTWTLILRYELHQFGGNETELLDWTKELALRHNVDFAGGWANGFNDGKAFAAMVHEAEPECFDLEETDKMAPNERLQTAFDAGVCARAEADAAFGRIVVRFGDAG
jgi:hypothetical protein